MRPRRGWHNSEFRENLLTLTSIWSLRPTRRYGEAIFPAQRDICEAVGCRLRRGWHVNCEAKSLLNPESNKAILLTKGKIDQIPIWNLRREASQTMMLRKGAACTLQGFPLVIVNNYTSQCSNSDHMFYVHVQCLESCQERALPNCQRYKLLDNTDSTQNHKWSDIHPLLGGRNVGVE